MRTASQATHVRAVASCLPLSRRFYADWGWIKMCREDSYAEHLKIKASASNVQA